MVRNGLEGRRLRRNLASVASRAHKVHGTKDDRSLRGFVNLKDEDKGDCDNSSRWILPQSDSTRYMGLVLNRSYNIFSLIPYIANGKLGTSKLLSGNDRIKSV